MRSTCFVTDQNMLVFVAYFLEYVLLYLDDNIDEEYEQFPNSKSSTSGYCLGFAFFANFSLALLIKKVLLI